MSFTPRSIGITLLLLVAMFYAPALVGVVNARSLGRYWTVEAPWFKALVVVGMLLWLAWLLWIAATLMGEARDRK